MMAEKNKNKTFFPVYMRSFSMLILFYKPLNDSQAAIKIPVTFVTGIVK